MRYEIASILRGLRRDRLTFVLATVAAGLGVAAATTISLTGLMSPLLFGLRAREPLVFVAAAAVVLGAGLLASYAPARRASRVALADALRPF